MKFPEDEVGQTCSLGPMSDEKVPRGPDLGDEAPDAEVFRADGSSVLLASLFSRGPVALIFLRHYG